MDRIKLRPQDAKSYIVSKENYEAATKGVKPWVVTDSHGVMHRYAVCPWCDNSVTIVGLYKRENDARNKPYARHHPKSVANLVIYDEEEYYNCPVSAPSRKHDSFDLQPPTSPRAKFLLETMRLHFDKVVYAWNKTAPIKMSVAQAEKWLDEWRRDERWRYYDARIQNLPFMLAYSSPSISLINRKVKESSKIAKVLRQQPDLQLVSTGDGYCCIEAKSLSSHLLNYRLYVGGYRQRMIGEHFEESFCMMVSRDGRSLVNERVITDQTFMEKLLSMGDRWRPNQILMTVAEKVLG